MRFLVGLLLSSLACAEPASDVATRARHRAKNCRYHRLIFEAIRRRDGDAACTIMTEHVADIQRRVHRNLK